MSDPTSIAAAGLTGTAAALMASIGLEPAPLFWALAGASLGMSFAVATARYRAVAVFIAVVLCSSLFGSWIAQQYFGGAPISRNVFACGLAIFFHPLLQAAVLRLPVVFDSLLRKLGLVGARNE